MTQCRMSNRLRAYLGRPGLPLRAAPERRNRMPLAQTGLVAMLLATSNAALAGGLAYMDSTKCEDDDPKTVVNRNVALDLGALSYKEEGSDECEDLSLVEIVVAVGDPNDAGGGFGYSYGGGTGTVSGPLLAGGGGGATSEDDADSDEEEEEEEEKCGMGSLEPRSNGIGAVTVNSDIEAASWYKWGNGRAAELGPSVQAGIIRVNEPREQRLLDGSTTNQMSGEYGVESPDLFVNRTVVGYATQGCGDADACCTTTFTGALHDGFWDVTDLRIVGPYIGCSNPDGDGPNCEALGGKPYAFISFSWTIEYANPKRKRKRKQ